MKKYLLISITLLLIALTGCKETNKEPFEIKATTSNNIKIYHREADFTLAVEPENATGKVSYSWSASIPLANGSNEIIELSSVTGNTLTVKDLIYSFSVLGSEDSIDYNVNALTQIADPGTVFNVVCNATNKNEQSSAIFTIELITDQTKDPAYNEANSFHITISNGKEVTYNTLLYPYVLTATESNAKGLVNYKWYQSYDGSYNPSTPLSVSDSYELPKLTSGTATYICIAYDNESYWTESITVNYNDVINTASQFIEAYLGSYSDDTRKVTFYNKDGKSWFELEGLNSEKAPIYIKGYVKSWVANPLNALVTLEVTEYAMYDDPCQPISNTFEFQLYENEDFSGFTILPTYSAVDNLFIVETIKVSTLH